MSDSDSDEAAREAADRERHERRMEIERNMTAAAQVSQVRQSVMKGKTVRVRFMEDTMEPTLQPGDVLDIVGATALDIKPNDIVYYHSQDAFVVRRVVRHSMSSGDMAFVVKADASPSEVTIPAAQVIGRIPTLTRRGQTVIVGRVARDAKEQAVEVAGQALNWLQKAADKVGEMMQRFKK